MKYFAVLITLLRDRKNFLEEIRQGIRLESKIISLLIASSAFFAIYGAIIGASSSWQQVISSAIKLPALYLITLVICLPTLYFFDILFGSVLTFSQYGALILTTVAVISVLLFSFAPITLFFLISIHDYDFFLLLNVAIFTLTGLIGIKLFYEGMRSVAQFTPDVPSRSAIRFADDFTPQELEGLKDQELKELKKQSFKDQELKETTQATRTKLLQFWLVLYGLVGSQLGWTLRPFFGAPGEPFQLFRNIESNFYAQVIRIILNVLGFS
jgi:hypothetical protein